MRIVRTGLLTAICGLAVYSGLSLCAVGQGVIATSGSQYFCGDGLLQQTYPTCGNNKIDAGEGCDNGVQNGTICEVGYGQSCNYCNDDCQTITVKGPTCGDGVTNGNEQCDDANNNNNDSCSNACTSIVCGDGVVQGSEACDAGASNGTQCDPGTTSCSYCTDTCTRATVVAPRCGDGNIDAGEQCDDGNQINNDGCSNSCKTPSCGDGMVQAGEACDIGANNGTACNPGNGSCSYCNETCQYTEIVAPKCGDGRVDTDAGEQCDDGNKINTDSCTNLCKTPVCGDGAVNGSEQCDRAGQNGSVCTPGVGGTCTYCSATCETKTVVGAVCGDGNVDAGEQCDDGNKNNNDSCSNACVALTCGDGMISGAEQCDDGADNGKVCTPGSTACNYCTASCTKKTVNPAPVVEPTPATPTELLDTGSSLVPLPAFVAPVVEPVPAFTLSNPITLPVQLQATGGSEFWDGVSVVSSRNF